MRTKTKLDKLQCGYQRQISPKSAMFRRLTTREGRLTITPSPHCVFTSFTLGTERKQRYENVTARTNYRGSPWHNVRLLHN